MNYHCSITGETRCKCIKTNAKISSIQVDLKSSLRKLFTDHAVYTKFILNAIINKTPDLNILLEHLMINQEDIGNQLKPIIGDYNGNMLIMLLKKHIELAGSNKMAVNLPFNLFLIENNIKMLFSNGEQVARFLTFLNPIKLHYDVIKDMFNRHNQFIIHMIKARISGSYQNEYKLYDACYNELLEMSDTIVNAL